MRGLVLAVAVVAGWVLTLRWTPPLQGAWARYPELAVFRDDVTRPLEYDLEVSLGTRRLAGRNDTRFVEHDESDAERRRRERTEWLFSADTNSHPHRLEVPAAWIADHGIPAPPFRIFDGDSADDATERPAAWFLREHPAADVDAVALRMARDRGLTAETRVRAFVVIARPGNAAAQAALVDVAMDSRESPQLRFDALRRLARCGTPIPEGVAGLLDLPFGHLDLRAAAVLGSAGQPTRPSLLAETLRRASRPWSSIHWSRRPDAESAMDAIRQLAAGDAEVENALATTTADLAERRKHPTTDGDACGALADLADVFAAWIGRHPDAGATPQERARAACTARALHVAARHATIDDVAACPETSLDVVAAASMLLDGDAARAADSLADLDRVAAWLRPQLATDAPPGETLARMQSLLVPEREAMGWAFDPNDVESTLRTRSGNCVGWTVTFVALGERLGLPLRAVEIPGHVFVRWDDGRVRMNWDPMNFGVSLTDEAALRSFSNPPRAAQDAGVRVLGRRELVSVILSNEAWIRLWRDNASDDAHRLAEDALRLDPANSLAHLLEVAALARAKPPRLDDVRRAAERATSDATSLHHLESIAANLTHAGLCDDALALLDRRPAQEPRRWERRFVLADALCRAGRPEESIALAASLSQERPSDDQVAALYASAAFGVSAERGWTVLARAATRRESDTEHDFDLGSRGALLLTVARRLLDDAPATAERARLALDVADFLVAREDAPPVAHGIRRSRRNLDWDEEEKQLSEVRASAWERLGDAAQASQIREAVRSKRK